MAPVWLLVCAAGALVGLASWAWLGNPAADRLRRLRGGNDEEHSRGGYSEHSVTGRPERGDATSPATSRFRLRRRQGTGDMRAADESAIAVVDRCAELLRVGVPPVRAIAHIAGLGTDTELQTVLHKVARSLELGEPPHEAIRRHAGELPPRVADVLDGMAAVWFVAETSGAPAAEMMAEYSRSCRLKADSQRERDVALAGPQSTVRVLTWLPVISLGLSMLIGANPLRLALTPMGFVALSAGVALLCAGRFWMRSMLRRAQ